MITDRPTKEQLLKHYAEPYTEPRRYLEIDGFINHDGWIDDVLFPDAQRHGIMYHEEFELWRGEYAVRLCIGENTSKADAIHFLKEAIAILENDGEPSAILAEIGGGGFWNIDESEPPYKPDNIIPF